MTGEGNPKNTGVTIIKVIHCYFGLVLWNSKYYQKTHKTTHGIYNCFLHQYEKNIFSQHLVSKWNQTTNQMVCWKCSSPSQVLNLRWFLGGQETSPSFATRIWRMSSPAPHPAPRWTPKEVEMQNLTSWWFQPSRKILVKLDHFPK